MKINKSTILITIITLAFLIIAYFLWKLWVYVTIAAVISLILNPLNLKLKKIHYKHYYIPSFLRSILLLVVFWAVAFIIASTIIPLLVNEIYNLASINPELLNAKISVPLEGIRKTLYSLGLLNTENSDLSSVLVNKFMYFFNAGNIQNIFGNIITFVMDIIVAVFVITFISFFFLKDDKLFTRTILIFVPVSYQTEVKHVLVSISKMLMRYFSGVVLDMIVVFTLISIGMGITGCNLNTAILLGLVAALFNIIPYIGPILSFSIGMLFGFLTNINYDLNTTILPHMLYMAIVYLTVNILDASLIQPFIYSNAIKAHPLEIFIVILASGMLSGVIGMMLAIPAYMTLRIIAKEFFYQFYIVKNLTKNI
ncbi:MAG TPA: AI-2E family transporter [Bacteroidales bacterium]|jgi:predicted PurR-regulated permease PerM|nr:AI-2E family transporter [Bacteroidales bacterium]HNV95781.1 AI-2E family transporter [Bacteroidales bacterium]HOU97318.1 AI-2E family transporter [Bacteroidales bacterium]